MQTKTHLTLLLLLQISAQICNSTILSTKSRWIINSSTGKRVKLACINWPSALQPMLAEGLEKKPLNHIAKQIPTLGFNCVRFTWATYMFTRPDHANLKVSESLDRWNLSRAREGIARNNPELMNMSVVDVHVSVVNELGKAGVMVALDNHVSRPGWCCDWNDGNAFFGDEFFSPEEWLQGLVAAARAYKGNAAVIGMSLRNELRGDRQNTKDWYKYMKQGAEAIHAENPDLLVIVSGLTFAGELGFLKSQQLDVNLHNKLVFEAHWYAFGSPADKWIDQTNLLCARTMQQVGDAFLFLITGENSFPLFLSEFGVNQNGGNEADDRYIGCLMAAAAERDLDWALWSLQGSYMLREGVVDLEEIYGVYDLGWDKPRNPGFLQRLQLLTRVNQDFNTTNPTYYKLFHPLSGQCVQKSNKGSTIVSVSCDHASRWEQHQDGGPIRLVGSPQCLGLARDGAVARVSEQDCLSNGTMWKSISSSGLHLGAKYGEGKYLCLEKNASDSQIVAKKCLCVEDDLADVTTCADNPQTQWFKFVPTNQHNEGLRSKGSMWESVMVVVVILILLKH